MAEDLQYTVTVWCDKNGGRGEWTGVAESWGDAIHKARVAFCKSSAMAGSLDQPDEDDVFIAGVRLEDAYPW